MYSPSRGILYPDLPTADDDEDEETRSRSQPVAATESSLEDPSAADIPAARSPADSVPEPADD